MPTGLPEPAAFSAGPRFSSILSPDAVFPRLESADADGVIAEMVEGLQERFPSLPWEGVEWTLRKRERTGSTSLGDGIAVPHGRWHGDFFGAFGFSPAGAEFYGLDGKKVHLVFCVLSPAGRAGEHLKLFAAISLLARDERFREAVKSASDAGSIWGIIAGEEGRIFRSDR